MMNKYMEIFIVLILSLFLRIISLNQSLWLDEATTALVSKMDLKMFFMQFIPNDFHPPLYYNILQAWTYLFGTSEIVLRVPSLIFGILTVYVTYLIASRFEGNSLGKIKWPIVPALFLATSGLHIYYSQEARMYALATLLVSLIFLNYIDKKWLNLSLLFALLFLTDYLSMIVLPVLFIHTYFKDYKNLKKLLLSTIPLIVIFLLWSPIFFSQLDSGLALKTENSSWWNALGPVTVKNVALIPTKFLIGRVSFENKLIYGGVMSIISLFFIYIIGNAKNKLFWNWFGLSLFLGIVVSFFIPTLTYFRYLFILPAFYLLLSETKSKIFIVLILIVNLLSSYFYLSWPKFQRENWRSIKPVVGTNKIITPSTSQNEALVYYDLKNQVVYYKEFSDTKNNSEVWLSRYVTDISDPSNLSVKYLENLGYNWVEEKNFNGVVFWKYKL